MIKNQIQTAIDLRDRARQVALSFAGRNISSSDGSYDLLIEVVHEALTSAIEEDRARRELTDIQLRNSARRRRALTNAPPGLRSGSAISAAPSGGNK